MTNYNTCKEILAINNIHNMPHITLAAYTFANREKFSAAEAIKLARTYKSSCNEGDLIASFVDAALDAQIDQQLHEVFMKHVLTPGVNLRKLTQARMIARQSISCAIRSAVEFACQADVDSLEAYLAAGIAHEVMHFDFSQNQIG